MKKLLCFIFAVSVFSSCQNEENSMRLLEDGWMFSYRDEWHQASVPGSIFKDLQENGFISEPFTGDNARDLQWIGQKDWSYRYSFPLDKKLQQYSHHVLLFEGLDTYARVDLNGENLLTANNMFRNYYLDVSHLLKEENELRVLFLSPENETEKRYQQLPYDLPGGQRAVARKAAFHFGWDWAPKLLSSGFNGSTVLLSFNEFFIDQVAVLTDTILDNHANMKVLLKVYSAKDQMVELDLNIRNNNKDSSKKLRLKKGMNALQWEVRIDEPKLWWTHDQGDPYLYHYDIELSGEHSTDSYQGRFGIRTIRLIQEKDGDGASFAFHLNGKPVFMKGANYVPYDMLNRLDDQKLIKILSQAQEAHMNMLRVWGGGIYETETFYNICDSLGIMVWQDFMFANTLFPAGELFLENVREEATQQVQRLRAHPSIALWCGNNEIDEAWHNWGWPRSYSTADSALLWEHYQTIFHDLLPGIVERHHAGVDYVSSSPMFGRGDERSDYMGDSHYWGVWHDAEPFSSYEEHTGRFMSEYGFQAYANIDTWEHYIRDENLDFASPEIQFHQKHKRGEELIKGHMLKYYGVVPSSPEEYVYLSQLLQAKAMRTGIEAHRRSAPYCMGSLFWQLNDTWPAVSWSAIDFAGYPKAMYYTAKAGFAPHALSIQAHGDSLYVHFMSDKTYREKRTLCLSLSDFSGERRYADTVEIAAEKQRIALSLEEINIPGNERNSLGVSCKWYKCDSLLAAKSFCFVDPLHLNLEKDYELIHKVEKLKKGFIIQLKANSWVKDLCLKANLKGRFSDNYFDILPGEMKEVLFIPEGTSDGEQVEFSWIALNDIVGVKE